MRFCVLLNITLYSKKMQCVVPGSGPCTSVSRKRKVGVCVRGQKKLRGKYDQTMKSLSVPSPDHWSKLLSSPNLPPQIVGIDMSLSNPGVALLDRTQRILTLYWFRNRKRELAYSQQRINAPGSPLHNWQIQTQIWEPAETSAVPKSSLFRLRKYWPRIHQIVAFIQSLGAGAVAGIEGYSFYTKATQADTTLKELGGILRWELSKAGVDMMEIPPSVIKKLFSGKGNATKQQMYTAYCQQFAGPSLYDMLNIPFNPKTKSKNLPPHPIEDLVDGLAVAMSMLIMLDSKKGKTLQMTRTTDE